MVWSMIGDALHRYVQALALCVIFTFVDDFFGAGTWKHAMEAQTHVHNAIRGTLGHEGLSVKKNVFSQTAEILGYHVDFTTETVRPKTGAIEKLFFVLFCVTQSEPQTLRYWQCLASLVNMYSMGGTPSALFEIQLWRAAIVIAIQDPTQMAVPLRTFVANPREKNAHPIISDASPWRLCAALYHRDTGHLMAWTTYRLPYAKDIEARSQGHREYLGNLLALILLIRFHKTRAQWPRAPLEYYWVNDNQGALAWAEKKKCSSLASQYACARKLRPAGNRSQKAPNTRFRTPNAPRARLTPPRIPTHPSTAVKYPKRNATIVTYSTGEKMWLTVIGTDPYMRIQNPAWIAGEMIFAGTSIPWRETCVLAFLAATREAPRALTPKAAFNYLSAARKFLQNGGVDTTFLENSQYIRNTKASMQIAFRLQTGITDKDTLRLPVSGDMIAGHHSAVKGTGNYTILDLAEFTAEILAYTTLSRVSEYLETRARDTTNARGAHTLRSNDVLFEFSDGAIVAAHDVADRQFAKVVGCLVNIRTAKNDKTGRLLHEEYAGRPDHVLHHMGALELCPAGKTSGRKITFLYPSVKVDVATHVLEPATTRYGTHVWAGRDASILPLPQNRGRNSASCSRDARIRDKADGGMEIRCLPGVCA
eukprot:gene61774-biopygen27206